MAGGSRLPQAAVRGIIRHDLSPPQKDSAVTGFTRAALLLVCIPITACAQPRPEPGEPGARECPASAPPKTHELKIRLGWSGKPKGVVSMGRDADVYYVCGGDTLTWRPEKDKNLDKKFFIVFDDESPFKGSLRPSKNGKVNGTVKAAGRQDQKFKYWVIVENGGALDPIIIIRTVR